MGNGVTGIPQVFGTLRCASESRFPSSRLRSSSGRARPWYGRGRGFDSRRRLHVAVVSAVSTRACQVRSAGSNPAGHSRPRSPACFRPWQADKAAQPQRADALLDQLAESPRSDRGGSEFESRVGHAVRRGDHGRSGLRVPGGSPVPAHCSTESEPARVPGLAANECALRRSVRVARSPPWEMTSPGGDPRLEG